MKKSLTKKKYLQFKSKWKKLARKGAYSKIGKDIVGYNIGKYLVIVQGIYNRDLSPTVWFEIQTKDEISFAMSSKALEVFLKQNKL